LIQVCGELPKAFIVKCDETLAAEEVHEFIKGSESEIFTIIF
jgi:hypothetical protein